ncbi:MAG: NTP transferase domain-containing protein [Anaerolineales bacterium]|nr:NTP transferase domain-containing protein [Chloroflexota bacterium]MBL6982302.1 NTP transferase domain-containing protein [Anaerolineales bacterium]
MKAVVLAGGEGTRLAPYSKKLPKPLMPIGDMPILEILIHQMKLAGVDEVILAVGHGMDALNAYFQNGNQFGIKINYSTEQFPLGTIGPLSLIEGLDESFLVTNGDILTTLDFQELIQQHQKSQATATIAMHARHVKIDLGVLELADGKEEIVRYLEKPTYHFHVSMGIYVFDPQVLHYIPSNQYYDFPELVHKLIDQGKKVIGYPFDGYWQDLGNPDDYEQAILDFDVHKHQILRD